MTKLEIIYHNSQQIKQIWWQIIPNRSSYKANNCNCGTHIN